MSHEELALETQLLLQEVSQVAQYQQAEAIVEEATAPVAPTSQLEEAKNALLEKLKRRKEAKRQQLQQVNSRRFGVGALPSAIKTDAASQQQQPASTATTATTPRKVSPMKARSLMKLPVAAGAGAASRKQKDMLSKLRNQAIQQGSQEMAKLFGYASYEEQLKHLNKIEKQKILQHELLEQAAAIGSGATAQADVEMLEGDDDDENDSDYHDGAEDAGDGDEDDGNRADGVAADGSAAVETVDAPAADSEIEGIEPTTTATAGSADAAVDGADTSSAVAASSSLPVTSSRYIASTVTPSTASPAAASKRRTNRISVDDDDDDDGNDADSEQDGKEGDDEDDEDEDRTKQPPTDRAAAYRRLLQAEARATKQRKRLKQTGDFVEAEAEEDDDDDALKIGGLGDFGFGVPMAKTQATKDAEDERNALTMRDDDLDGIVDDLSDDEREQAADLDALFRQELEAQDRQQVKEVMRNVKEGFGRNRRAFSAGLHGAEARGRFNLDELVAADGKIEAARLGLLESDEELSDGESGAKAKAKRKAKRTSNDDSDENEGGDDDDGDDEDEDEEAEMERLLRERFQNQPKIYITSSESEGDDDDDDVARAALRTSGDTAADRELASDEEREKQQMKLFSERARINRRMHRMKELQRQVALEQSADVPAAAAVAMPNLLLDDDEDSQELMKLLNRTDKTRTQPSTIRSADVRSAAVTAAATGSRKPVGRPRRGFGIAAAARSTSSFSRIAANVKMFNANSSGAAAAASSKGFVFTASFSADRMDQGDENVVPVDNDEDLPAAPTSSHAVLAKSQSWSVGGNKRGAAAAGAGRAKKQLRKSGFLSALSSFERVSQTTARATSSSSSSQPM